MFEKFQKLFFEEEDEFEDEYDDEYEDEEEEVKPARKKEKGSLFGKKASSILAIDDDDDDDDDLPVIVKKTDSVVPVQTKPVVQQPVVEKPVVQQPVVEEKPVETKEEKAFGLSVDEIAPVQVQEEVKARPLAAKEVKQFDFQQTKQPVKQTTTAQAKQVKPSHENPYATRTSRNQLGGNVVTSTKKRASLSTNNSTYLFAPVISPMFGVDEKTLNSFNETRKIVDEQMELHETSHSEVKHDTMEDLAMKSVISPMYGANLTNPVTEAVEARKEAEKLSREIEQPKIQPLDGSNSVQYQSLDDLIKEGRSVASEENLEATKAFKFEDLLTDDEPITSLVDEPESDKKVESPFSAYNLFSDIEENDD